MQRSTRDIMFIFGGLFIAIGLLGAARMDGASRLGSDVAYLNAIGARRQGAARMERSLAERFAVTPARIAALRAARMGEGDVAAALAAASLLPHGGSDAALAKVLALWKASPPGGWAGIVKSLGLSAERVAVSVERVTAGPAPRARPKTPLARSSSRPGYVTVRGLGRSG